MIAFKQRWTRFLENRRSEWPPFFAKFDRIVDPIAIANIARISKDGAVAERSWSKLLPALVPPDEPSARKQISRLFGRVV